jgi:hypothetical protein
VKGPTQQGIPTGFSSRKKKGDFTRNQVYCKLKHEIYPAKKKQQFMKI